MNSSILLLHALKGTCALNCLAALHLAGPLPVTQRTIMDLTGFDDGAVSKGLNTLLVIGLATCTGDKHRTAWALDPAAHNLPLPLGPFRPIPENAESGLLKEEELTVETDISINLDSARIDSAIPGIAVPEPGRTQSSTLPAAPNSPRKTAAPRPEAGRAAWPRALPAGHPDHRLRAHFYAAFEAANVYLQFRRPLAEALLADDGPAWLRQTLGWICYAERQLTHVKRGAVVYVSLRDRLPCDSAYLPPPELAFEAALAWAERGGAEPEPDADEQTFRVSETLKVSDSPHDQLWRAVIDKLSRELPPAVIDSQLRPARLVALDGGRCRLAVPTPQSRAWLAARLAPVLARALTELTGAAITVEFVGEA